MSEIYYKKFLAENPHPRKLTSYDAHPSMTLGRSVLYQGHPRLNFSSNDYLGLAQHPLLIQRAQEWTELYGTGSSSSRLVVGNLSHYDQIEMQLAGCLKKEAAVIIGSGFQANTTVLQALFDQQILGQKPLVFADRLCHASIMLPVVAATDFHRFHHNDLTHLKKLLDKYSDKNRPIFIVAESIYSMEGDRADLNQLAELAKEYQAFLYIDDAHAVGVYGSEGWGLAPEMAENIPLIMGTFSKALGSFGGYIGCSQVMKDYLINRCKGLIYSTALPPAVLGAISALFEIMPTLDAARKTVIQHAQFLRENLHQSGINVGQSDTPIVPWILKDADKALRASQLLADEGILAVAIRPPSVLPQASRVRFCLSSAHTEQDVITLVKAIQKVEQCL